MCPTASSNCLEIMYLLTLSVSSIFHWHLICNAWYCAAIISISVSPFTFALDSHGNVYSSLIICLCIIVIYWPCMTLTSLLSLKDTYNFAFICLMLSFFASLFQFDWFNISATFPAVLIVEFTFSWRLSWVATIFTKWSSAYSVFRYCAILFISALYVLLLLLSLFLGITFMEGVYSWYNIHLKQTMCLGYKML